MNIKSFKKLIINLRISIYLHIYICQYVGKFHLICATCHNLIISKIRKILNFEKFRKFKNLENSEFFEF